MALKIDVLLSERLPKLNDPAVRQQIEEICRANKVRRLSFFGSVLREDFSQRESDIDLLVEFEPDARGGLIQLAEIELELSDLLGKNVDLRTAGQLSRYFRRTVEETAREVYAA